MELLARDRGVADRVHFLGPLEPAALPDFYRGLDVLAVPSLTTPSWVEQFGRVVVEAMACGTPVVASDTGALPEVVQDCGLIVPEGDAAELGGALERIGHDPALADRLRAAGLVRAAAMSWERVADDYEALYGSVLHTARTPLDVRRPIEVLVVAYGQPEMLAAALEPVRKLPVLVVDNSSSAEVRAVCERAGARYVDPGRNGGFAAGVNEGLRHLADPTADVLLLNPDAVVSREAVECLGEALSSDPALASVGPQQVDDDGHSAHIAWPFPSPAGAWLEAVGLGRLRRPQFVVGSVLLLRREALDQVGGFDEERFFLYSEETDWARRAVRLGWRHRVEPAARAVHVGGAMSTDHARREALFHAAQEIYLRKHFGRTGWQVARAAVVSGSAVRGVVLPGERGAVARKRTRLYLDGPARRSRSLLPRGGLAEVTT